MKYYCISTMLPNDIHWPTSSKETDCYLGSTVITATQDSGGVVASVYATTKNVPNAHNHQGITSDGVQGCFPLAAGFPNTYYIISATEMCVRSFPHGWTILNSTPVVITKKTLQ